MENLNPARLTLVTFLGLSAVAILLGTLAFVILFEAVEKSNRKLQIRNDQVYGRQLAAALEAQLQRGVDPDMILESLQQSFELKPGDENRYVCLLGTVDAKVLCHPNTGYLGHSGEGMLILPPEVQRPLPYLEWASAGGSEGLLVRRDGTPIEIVHRFPVPSGGWDVLVHTELDAFTEAMASLQRTVLLVMIPMLVLLVLLGTLVVRSLGRRYEAAIETTNRALEQRVEERTAELRRTVAELRQARDALVINEKMALLGQLLAGIAHEIRSPLAAINLLAQNLEEEAPTPEDATTARHLIASAHRANTVVQSLLAYARNEPPQLRRTPLRPLVENALTFCRKEAHNANVKLETRLPDEEATAEVDPIQVEQVLINLVANAIQAIEPTDLEDRRVRVTLTSGNEALILTVEDCGPGLPAEILENLFEPFHTLRPGGTGLGLSLCRRFVEHHQGNIVHAASRDLGGASFRIRLPTHARRDGSSRASAPPAVVG